MRLNKVVVAAAIMASWTGLGYAADTMEKTNKLVSQIHQANETEVELGELAVQMAQSPSIKNFGQQMVSAHSESDKKLLSLVNSEHLTIDPLPVEKSNSPGAKLMKKTGADFDKEYIDMMVNGHNKLIGELKSAQSWLPEGAVKNMVQELIPTVDHHLMMAKQIDIDRKKTK